MEYPKEFFNIQLKFAVKASVISGKDLDQTLIDYTSYYKLFGISGWEFDTTHPIWKEFIKRFNNSENKLSFIYEHYKEKGGIKEEEDKERFGCFSYELEEKDNCVSIHFRNLDKSGLGPLSNESKSQRIKELKQMFKSVKNNFPEVKTVCGFSWLYNLESYTRLFPPQYTNNPKVVNTWYKSMAIWGQFFVHTGKLKKAAVVGFLKKVVKAKTLEELKNSFPLKLIEVSAPIRYFYEFYEIK